MADITTDLELKQMLRDMIASNLTVAYQIEMMRREMNPSGEEGHPLSDVLDMYDMVREVMAPDDGSETDLEAEELVTDLPSNVPRVKEAGPFASTMRYLRPRRGTPPSDREDG